MTEEATPPSAAEPEPNVQNWEYPGGWTFYYYHFVRFTCWFIALFYLRISVKGWRNIPTEGPVLLVSNHSSHLDPPLIAGACRRRLAFLAKSELFRSKLFGAALMGLGAFPINRGAGDRAALRTTIALLRKGYPLLMFPEGNRTLTGELGEAKTGVAMLLAQVPEAAVVPVRIDGTFQSWPPGVSFPRPGKVTITVGKPFRISELKDLPTVKKQLYHEIGREIMKRISQV